MKTKILSVLIGLGCFIQPLFAQDAATNAAPVIPEAAREHFVMGTTLYSNATTVAGFKLAAKEFQQAAELAPQWSKPRYNLALTEEAAEDYAGAIDDLKRYQAFNLTDGEARAVQDKIYTLKARQALKVEEIAATEAKKRQEEESSPEKVAERFLRSLDGSVFYGSMGDPGPGSTMEGEPWTATQATIRIEGDMATKVVRNKYGGEWHESVQWRAKIVGKKFKHREDNPNVEISETCEISADGEMIVDEGDFNGSANKITLRKH